MEIFETCQLINDHIAGNRQTEARNELIKLLDHLESNQLPYSELVNHLIRATGLYPYLDTDTSNWQDKFVYEVFKVNTGDPEEKTLHREQSSLLKKLLNGESIAVSAPTSFGKSFVIDAFISLRKPKNVVIIVPTIALTDETRRRLYKKFAKSYKIITTPEVDLTDSNIFIFPQERAINYIDKIEEIDILIIDEFYKAGIEFDKDRAPILLKAILELGKKSKQKYFLAPNISSLNQSPFTDGMEFVALNFNTVFTEKHDLYRQTDIINDEFKEAQLIKILSSKKTKSLIYAGTYSNIDYITNVLNSNSSTLDNKLLLDFSDWLAINYHPQYILTEIVKKGIGIHNGQLHRSLSQIQIRLFEESDGLQNIVSTSSIIEGVNTSAENVIIWANKNGKLKLNDFTYKNIVGRGGRMFRHFIGKVYLLDEPPSTEATQLNLEFTDDLLNSLDTTVHTDLTREQVIKIVAFNDEMNALLGEGMYKEMINENAFQSFNSNTIKTIALNMKQDPGSWSGLAYLNSNNPNHWDRSLLKVLPYVGSVGASYRDMVAYIKAISNNWNKPIPDILANLRSNGVTIEKFFELERIASFKVSSVLNDINQLQKHMLRNTIDISSFTTKLSNAFLPSIVYLLEEYGLPRMISKKIHDNGILNLEGPDLAIHDVINQFSSIGRGNLISQLKNIHSFENFIVEFFYDGITSNDSAIA